MHHAACWPWWGVGSTLLMSVTTPHKQYTDAQYTWEALRAAYAGSGIVKSHMDYRSPRHDVKIAGTRYLPRPLGMTSNAQYELYRDRAIWYGATARAVHGLTGAVFRKEPQLEAPDISRLQVQLEDVTQTGVPLRSFAERAVRETLLRGRYGLLVDFPQTLPDEPAGMPLAVQRPI